LVGNDPLDGAQKLGELGEKQAQKWELVALERCYTSIAYAMRLSLHGIHERKDAEEAGKLFRNWSAWVYAKREQSDGLLEPLDQGPSKVEGQLEGILAD